MTDPSKKNQDNAVEWVVEHHLKRVSPYKWSLDEFKGKSEKEIEGIIEKKIREGEAGKPGEPMLAKGVGTDSQRKLAETVAARLRELKPEEAGIIGDALKILEVQDRIRERGPTLKLKRELWRLQRFVEPRELAILADIRELDEKKAGLESAAEAVSALPREIFPSDPGYGEWVDAWARLRSAREEFVGEARGRGFGRGYVDKTVVELEERYLSE